MDYFKKILADLTPENYIDEEGNQCGRLDIDTIWNKDVNEYRQHSIKMYNGDVKKGTDKFCVSQFLNTYLTAINVFNLHGELNGKKTFNQLINVSWHIINDNDTVLTDATTKTELDQILDTLWSNIEVILSDLEYGHLSREERISNETLDSHYDEIENIGSTIFNNVSYLSISIEDDMAIGEIQSILSEMIEYKNKLEIFKNEISTIISENHFNTNDIGKTVKLINECFIKMGLNKKYNN